MNILKFCLLNRKNLKYINLNLFYSIKRKNNINKIIIIQEYIVHEKI